MTLFREMSRKLMMRMIRMTRLKRYWHMELKMAPDRHMELTMAPYCAVYSLRHTPPKARPGLARLRMHAPKGASIQLA